MRKARKARELSSSKLKWRCSPGVFKFKTTADIKPCSDIIGQDRALMSIKMGLDLKHRGYNIFITGLVGTGRTTTIKHLLERLEEKDVIPPDICFMNNFRDPSMPVQIELMAGEGVRLAAVMDGMIFDLAKKIPTLFNSEYYQERKKKVLEKFQERQKKSITEFEKEINKEGFTLVTVQVGNLIKPQIVPLIDGAPVDYAQVVKMVEEGKISSEKFEEMKRNVEHLSEKMNQVYSLMKVLEKEMREKLEKLDMDIVQPIVHEMIDDIGKKFKNDKLSEVLGGIERAIMKKLDLFRGKEEEDNEQKSILALVTEADGAEDPFREFRVNVVVDNSETKAPPVIIENFPNMRNIFGVIEREFLPSGWSRPDHMNIRGGAFHKANGGYLVMNALDVFIEPGVWQILKRTLKSGEAVIQNYDPFSFMSSSALKPEPIKMKIKIVLIGDAHLYYMLQSYDEDFRKIFKIRADFDREADKSAGLVRQYAGFIRALGEKEGILPFDRSGVAAVVEYGVRVAGRQNKISTRFSLIADIIRESHYHASKANSRTVRKEHVKKALEGRVMRVNLLEEKIQERIDEGTIMIDTSGSVTGQVNALSVYNMGDYMFGRPSRITARTSLGNSGVINIEREADLSGSTHNKGVLILSGYMRGKYGRDNPLVMSASLCFEQSYGGVDGDSASSTELYAILSSLAEIPLRQDIAVTGSINQKGEIQPIGGVNEKIEGFFKVCSSKGLKGTEGVIIPWQNIPDLMLDDEVVEAVKKKRFHIYPVKTVDEGISILTGVDAGRQLKSGFYPRETVNGMVQARLFEMALKWKKFGTDRERKES